MNRLISLLNALGNACMTQINRLLPTLLVGVIFLTMGMNSALNSQDSKQENLGKAILQRVEATDKSNRPKTNGQFLDEAQDDMPLNERLGNITRDSAEAFKELGKEYNEPKLGQGIRGLRDGAAD